MGSAAEKREEAAKHVSEYGRACVTLGDGKKALRAEHIAKGWMLYGSASLVLDRAAKDQGLTLEQLKLVIASQSLGLADGDEEELQALAVKERTTYRKQLRTRALYYCRKALEIEYGIRTRPEREYQAPAIPKSDGEWAWRPEHGELPPKPKQKRRVRLHVPPSMPEQVHEAFEDERPEPATEDLRHQVALLKEIASALQLAYINAVCEHGDRTPAQIAKRLDKRLADIRQVRLQLRKKAEKLGLSTSGA